MRPWRIKHYILAGILASVTFAVAFALGAGIIAATGIPATGGVANIFAAVLVITIGLKLVPRFGFATLTLGLLFAFAVPTIICGPPGIYKIVNGVIVGLGVDVIVMLGKRTWLAHVAAGMVGAVLSIVSIYFALVLLGLPGADRLLPLLLPLAGLQAVIGAVAAWAGLSLFERRLKRLETVKRLMDVNSSANGGD